MENISRELAKELTEMAACYPVVTVIGPRQSGKTTLVRRLFPNKPYVSFEDMDERELAASDPKGFLARYPEGAIFDEIQRLPALLSYIQGIVDKQQIKGMFILTGSHQLQLHESVSQSLAGRTAILKLLPFTINELKKGNRVLFSLDEYIFKGMYPRIFKENISPSKFYRDYVQTYIERDVRQMVNIKDLQVFQHFLKLCAGRIGQIFNSHSLSNELGVTHNTVRNWLSVLEASFLVFRLQPYYENFGKRIIKSPKLYFTDTGLASYLLDIREISQIERDPLRGSLVENLVILECFKNQLNKGIEPSLFYYRDSNNNEIDLLFKSGSKLIPIEIKSAKTFNSEFLKNLKYFENISASRFSRGYLIYSGEQEQNIGNIQLLNYTNIHKIF